MTGWWFEGADQVKMALAFPAVAVTFRGAEGGAGGGSTERTCHQRPFPATVPAVESSPTYKTLFVGSDESRASAPMLLKDVPPKLLWRVPPVRPIKGF